MLGDPTAFGLEAQVYGSSRSSSPSKYGLYAPQTVGKTLTENDIYMRSNEDNYSQIDYIFEDLREYVRSIPFS